MAYEPHFYLKGNKNGLATIYLGVQIDGSFFKYYTKHKILPELFDKKSQRAVEDKDVLKEYRNNGAQNIRLIQMSINSFLNDLHENTNTIINNSLKRHGKITKEVLKQELDYIYKAPKKERENSLTFVEYLLDFISKCESGKKLNGTKKYAPNTIKSYKALYNFLKGKIDKRTNKIAVGYNPRLKFDEVTIDFYDKLVYHLNQQNKKPNTIGKYIKEIKAVMRDAYEHGYHKNEAFKHKNFKKISVKVHSIYLTQSELDRIENLDLSSQNKFETYRDFFLIGCYTALRYSDFSRLAPKFIVKKSGKHYISMKTEKTKTHVEIPIKPLVFTILEKYNFTAPKWLTRNDMNTSLKVICMQAGIQDDITITEQIGGKFITKTVKKYSLISTKLCRKTGATLLYLNNAPLLEIKSITGHSQITQLLDYISISEEEIARRLSENPFFQ